MKQNDKATIVIFVILTSIAVFQSWRAGSAEAHRKEVQQELSKCATKLRPPMRAVHQDLQRKWYTVNVKGLDQYNVINCKSARNESLVMPRAIINGIGHCPLDSPKFTLVKLSNNAKLNSMVGTKNAKIEKKFDILTFEKTCPGSCTVSVSKP